MPAQWEMTQRTAEERAPVGAKNLRTVWILGAAMLFLFGFSVLYILRTGGQ
jgi:hypothetical protein